MTGIIVQLILASLTVFVMCNQMDKEDRKFWLDFLKEYRSLPCLWDDHDANFANRKVREQAYYTLLKKVRGVWPDAQMDIVKQRINSFRRTFINEYNKVQQSKKDRTCKYVPSLYYYNHLKFLKEDENVISSEQSEASDEEGDFELSTSKEDFESQTIPISDYTGDVDFIVTAKTGSSPTNEFYLVPSSSNEDSRPSKRQRLLQEPSESNVDDADSSEYHLEQVSENIGNATTLKLEPSYKTHNTNDVNDDFSEVEIISQVPSATLPLVQANAEDEFEVIAKRVAMHFRKMSPQQCLFAEKLVFDVCISGRLNHLTQDTNLSLSRNSSRQKNDIGFNS